MLMKLLGFGELVLGIIIGLHLLYGMFSRDAAMLALDYFFIRGIMFAVTSKDIASMIDLVFGTYALLVLVGIFPQQFIITIGLIVWHSQKAVFSLL